MTPFPFFNSFWTLLCQMSWPLLLGYFAAGIISQFISPEFIARHLGGKGLWQTIKASLFGIPLPLCSCGVLPVAESFRKIGVGRGALTSFMISTPQTGIDSIAVTYGMLGPFFALFRPVAAFISGVAGGIAVEFFGGMADKDSSADGQNEKGSSCCKSCCERKDSSVSDENPKEVGASAKFASAIRYGFSTLLGETAKSLLTGLAAGAILNMMVPDSFFEKIASAGGLVEMLAMLAFGIPLYVCASASVPVAAVLIAKGISPGAAFVFLMTGPASNTVSFTFMLKMIGSRGLLIYLLTLASSALIFGSIVDLLPFRMISDAASHCSSSEALSLLDNAGGILLAILMLRPVLAWIQDGIRRKR